MNYVDYQRAKWNLVRRETAHQLGLSGAYEDWLEREYPELFGGGRISAMTEDYLAAKQKWLSEHGGGDTTTPPGATTTPTGEKVDRTCQTVGGKLVCKPRTPKTDWGGLLPIGLVAAFAFIYMRSKA